MDSVKGTSAAPAQPAKTGLTGTQESPFKLLPGATALNQENFKDILDYHMALNAAMSRPVGKPADTKPTAT